MSQTITKLGAYKGVEVKKIEVIVDEKELAEELERARSYAATSVDKPDGIAAMGDEVTIDFTGYINGEAFQGGDGENYPLVLGSNTFIPGFEDQLVGAKVGDQVDVTVPFPDDYPETDYAGKDAVFKCAVKAIRSTFIPELSDEVVAQISPCKTVDEFREYVKSEIGKAKQDQADRQKEDALLSAIVDSSEFDIADEAVTAERDQLENKFRQQLQSNNMTLEDYLSYINMSTEEYNETSLAQAKEMIKGCAVLEEIAGLEGYEASEEEIDKYFEDMAAHYQMKAEDMKKMMGQKGIDAIRLDILRGKALKLIVAESVEV